eukprot:749735-Hanusia_phi.AAC.1
MWDMNEPEDILEGCLRGHYVSFRLPSPHFSILCPPPPPPISSRPPHLPAGFHPERLPHSWHCLCAPRRGLRCPPLRPLPCRRAHHVSQDQQVRRRKMADGDRSGAEKVGSGEEEEEEEREKEEEEEEEEEEENVKSDMLLIEDVVTWEQFPDAIRDLDPVTQ